MNSQRRDAGRQQSTIADPAGDGRRPGLAEFPYPAKWLVIGVVTGSAAGLGALALGGMLTLVTDGTLGWLAGFHPARPSGEGGFRAASSFATPWLIPLVVALGGLLSAIVVRWAAPEAGGHGTDAAIDTANRDPTGMRTRVPAVKLLASAITIGTGGSGGTEGPAAQISAGLTSVIARRFRLSHSDARIAVSAGLAAGVGAIFQTPVGAAVLGAELLVLNGLVLSALPPALISTTVAWLVFASVHGTGPLLGDQSAASLARPEYLCLVVVLGGLGGVVGRLYARTFYAASAWLRARRRRILWAIPGGLAVGLIGLAVPGVLGTGYGTAEQVTDGAFLASMSIWVLLALPFAKIVATSLTIGSGGSAGVFGPGLVIGAGLGAALWRVTAPLGFAGPSPAPYVIVGMACCLGAVVHAPIAVTLMVWEATDSPHLLPASALATAVAVAIVGRDTIYRSQLTTAGENQRASSFLVASWSYLAHRARVDRGLPFRRPRRLRPVPVIAPRDPEAWVSKPPSQRGTPTGAEPGAM